jgi:hypothetical protein
VAKNDQSNDEGWRDLALRIQVEKDPHKVVELAQELIAKLDEASSEKDSPNH